MVRPHNPAASVGVADVLVVVTWSNLQFADYDYAGPDSAPVTRQFLALHVVFQLGYFPGFLHVHFFFLGRKAS